MSQIQQIDKILDTHKRIIEIDKNHDTRMSYLQGWQDGFTDAFQKFCKHPETVDIGDGDHMAVACTVCNKVLEEEL